MQDKPWEVEPVVHEGVRYSTASLGVNQKGGWVVARAADDERLLWCKRLYTTHYSPTMDRQSQHVFITSLQVEGDKLVVEDELARRFEVNIPDGQLTYPESQLTSFYQCYRKQTFQEGAKCLLEGAEWGASLKTQLQTYKGAGWPRQLNKILEVMKWAGEDLREEWRLSEPEGETPDSRLPSVAEQARAFVRKRFGHYSAPLRGHLKSLFQEVNARDSQAPPDLVARLKSLHASLAEGSPPALVQLLAEQVERSVSGEEGFSRQSLLQIREWTVRMAQLLGQPSSPPG